MADYVYERSNARHVGVLILRDGTDQSKPTPQFKLVPLGDFVNECNASMDLFDGNSEFYTIMARGMQSTEELNSLAALGKTYGLQCKQWAVQIKNSGEPIYFLDSKFFNEEVEKIKQLSPNSPAQRATCRALYETFSRVVTNCIAWNKQTAQQLHLPPVQEARPKQK